MNDTKELQAHGRTVFIEWITTIAVFISCFVYLSHKIDKNCERTDKLYEAFCAESKAQTERTDKLYEAFCAQSKAQTERTDKLYEAFCAESKAQTERTDKLYEMFIDVVKEKK